jgi:hypothetical protein
MERQMFAADAGLLDLYLDSQWSLIRLDSSFELTKFESESS